ncbi:MAG TPA: glycosyltransferase family 39 protein [Chitinophagales bacterium]|nr:glycosyltransferase family 39 protein [Chitinophagales bacterium]
MLTSKRNLVIAFFAVLSFAFFLNAINLNAIRKQTDKSNEFLNKELVFNYTILSVDNSWYLPQIHNYLAGKGFTCDTSDAKLLVRRTPVYPMFYGIHYLFFGEQGSFKYIRITQTFLFALAAIAFLLSVFYFTQNKRIAWLSFFLFGFNPTIISYTFYTLTESLAPALIGFMLYFLARAYRYKSNKDWFIAGILFSVASLCRPTIFIFGGSVAILIFGLYLKNIKAMLQAGWYFGIAVLLLFTPYVIRNYKVTNGDFVLLEKYYNDPMDYGMQNIELRKWISTWINPAEYNSERISNKMISNVQTQPDKTFLIDSLMNTIPPAVASKYSKAEIEKVFSAVYDFYYYKYTTKGKNLDSAELASIQKVRVITTNYIHQHPIQHYVIMPMLFLKSIIVQSNSATMTYLDNYHTNKIAFAVKLLLILLNVYLFFTLVGNLIFFKKYNLLLLAIYWFVGINCGYMLIVLNYFEARYLIPLFPLMYISGAIFAVEIYAIIKRNLHF